MSQLSRLTVFTPTYNRQRFALRSMRFWSESDVQLLVMDGSSQPIPQEHLANLADNVRYVWMAATLQERLRAATQLIESEYVAMLADDEFFLESALKSCIEDLDAHSDVVTAVGRCANFWPSRYQLKANQRYPHWQSLSLEDPRDRLLHHASHFQPSACCAVSRCQPWVLSMQTAAIGRYASPYVIELQLEFIMTYMGKITVHDELMWLRSCENHPVHFPGWNRKLEFHQWYSDKRFQCEVGEFIRITGEKLASFCPGSDEQKITTYLVSAVELYVSTCVEPEGFTKDVRSFFVSILQGIAARLPRDIKYPVKKMLGLSKGQVDMRDLPGYFQQKGVSVDVKSLNRVIETLESFYRS